MFGKKYFALVFALFLAHQISAAAYSANHERSLVQGRDLFDVTRTLIISLVNTIEAAVGSLVSVVTSLLNLTEQLADTILANVNATLVAINDSLQAEVAALAGLGEEVLQCVQGHVSDVENLITNLGVQQCVSERVSAIHNVTTQALNLAQSGIEIAQNITNLMNACGQANLLNLVQVSACLNNVLLYAQQASGTLIAEITVTSAHVAGLVASTPISLAECVGELAQTVTAATQIISSISQCAGNAIVN